jgi:hypothetical protein
MFNSFRSWLAGFFSKPIVKTAVEAGASAYAGPAGAQAVEIIGPKVIDIIKPDTK